MAKVRHAVTQFASRVAIVEDMERKALRDFVKRLSAEEGLKNRRTKDTRMTHSAFFELGRRRLPRA